MAEKVKPDTFNPIHHKLKQHTEAKLTALLKEYDSQFMQDETSIGTTPLAEKAIDTADGGKCLVTDYCTLNSHQKIYLVYAKGRGYFLPVKWCKIFFNIGPMSWISPYSFG